MSFIDADVVHEKEKLRGHDSLRDDDDAGFGEYTRTYVVIMF